MTLPLMLAAVMALALFAYVSFALLFPEKLQ